MITKSLATLAVLTLGICALTASAAVIIDDTFTGTVGSPINPAIWSSGPGDVLDGTGHAELWYNRPNGTSHVAGNGEITALTSYATAPSASQFVRYTAYIAADSWNSCFFLNDALGTNRIQVRDDLGGSISVAIDNQGSPSGSWYYNTAVGKTPFNFVQIDYYTNKVLVSFNSSGVIYNSSVDTPTWVIPTFAAIPNVTEYYDVMLVDRVTFETVAIPEPATFALLGFVGLAALIRRKRG